MDAYKINDSAGVMARAMVDTARKRYSISATDESLNDTEILKSPCGTAMVRGYVLGALRSYHQQLRQSLMEQGIDIGPFLPEDDD